MAARWLGTAQVEVRHAGQMPSRARIRRREAGLLGPGSSAPVARGDAVLDLQRTVGNAAVTQMLAGPASRDIVQRVVLTERLSEATLAALRGRFGASIVEDLQGFHDVLVDQGKAQEYLGMLERDVERLVKIGVRPTRALSQALFEHEFWMELPRQEGKDYEEIPVEEGVVSTEGLVGHLGAARPLKDVGAAIPHGEWAHRIQLWILDRWAKKQEKDARRIYNALLVVTDRTDLVSKEEAPAVWSWVLDIPNDLTRSKEEPRVAASAESKDPQGPPRRLPPELPPEHVGLAAPARLTMGVTGIGAEGDFKAIPGVPTIRKALLNRRLKRYIESRIKQRVLTTELDNRNRAEHWGIVPEQLTKLTTPGRAAGALFTDLAKENPALREWGTERSYATWITRQDLSLRQALGNLAKADLGGLQEVVTVLGGLYTKPFGLERQLEYERRVKIVDALIEHTPLV